jgi:hypothetical protein
MFSLEAIKAKHGDCLLLHWGTAKAPHVALIDGGPNTVYADFLKPRLEDLAASRKVPKVRLDLTMVSHIDDDHITGLLDLAEEIEQNAAPAEIGLLWHNSLEGLLDADIPEGGGASVTASVASTFPSMATGDEWDRKVLASVPQGQELHAFAVRVGIADRLNAPFAKVGKTKLRLVMSGQAPAKIEGLKMTAIAPAAKEVEALRKKWVELRKEGIMAAFSDRSPYNLSSIVVLADFGKKRMLLTGDARGDLILQGLDEAGLLDDGAIHVDLLKLPHHGSQNNTTKEFFEAVTADSYVVSGDHVKFPNPHKKAMGWLAEARGGDDYRVYCTYDLDYMRDIFGDRLVVPKKGETSVEAKLS